MKLISLQNLSISQKLSLPLIIICTLISASVIYFGNNYINSEITGIINKDLKTIENDYKKNVDFRNQKALLTATTISHCSYVTKAYETYYTTYDLDSSSKILEKEINKITTSLEEIFNEKIGVQFHIPPGVVLFNNWSDRKGEDVSGSRKDLADLYKVQSTTSGIIADKDGYFITGMHPVFDDNKTLLGSIEVRFSLSEALLKVVNENKAEYIIFITNNKQSGAEPKIDDNKTQYFSIIDKSGDNIQLDLLKNTLSTLDKNKPGALLSGHYAFNILSVFNSKTTDNNLIAIQKDYSEVYSHYNFIKLAGIVAIVLLFSLVVLIMFLVTSNSVTKPFNQIIKILADLANGEHFRRIKIRGTDNISLMKRTINLLSENLINIEHFAHEIGEGKFKTTFKPRSKKDTLAYTLIDMKKKLQKAREDDEVRSQEEKIRTWHNSGISKLNEIIRKHSQNSDDFFYQIISNIVKQIDANQGGILIFDEDREYLELKGCYAYDRNKYLQKKVHSKEGLIGRCIQEKEFIYIKNLPKDYMTIVSATGNLSPQYLLIVPILREEQVIGIIEIASFNEFKENIISFVMESASSISMAINDLEYNIKTTKLLQESKEKESKLLQQEEEMRQNMEEMKATQEEFERREKELIDKIIKLEKTKI